jgi:hypothetical protein
MFMSPNPPNHDVRAIRFECDFGVVLRKVPLSTGSKPGKTKRTLTAGAKRKQTPAVPSWHGIAGRPKIAEGMYQRCIL